MSRDVQLARACPHLTMEEVVPLGADRRSLASRQPVAGSGTVRILVNDEFFLPQGGLYTPATLYATQSGPYDLLEGEDVLTVTASEGVQTLAFRVSGRARLTADEVVTFLAKNLLTVAVATSVNGHLTFVDPFRVGPDSFIKISGTAATALGFGSPKVSNRQWMSRGVQLYPAWRLHTRPDEITNRFPKFDQPIRTNPIFKLTYTVPATRCLRCGSARIENDYQFDAAGQIITIANEDLLYQAALKILLTDKGSNPYYDWYGTDLRSRIGTKALSGVASLINEDVRRALIKFQGLQEEQSKFQKVTFQERLYAILNVNVRPHAQDPTTYMIDVTIQNASSQPINLSIVFSVPNVVALMGSNGLMLGNEMAGLRPDQMPNLIRGGN